MNLMYISQGNIPSKWAHTFQTMKMADALAGEVDSLTMVTSGGLLPARCEMPDCADWYGINNGFAMVRLPLFWRVRDPFFSWWKCPRFDRAASLYARLKSPDLVYTRSANAGRLCVNLGLKTVIELHMGIERSELHHILAVAHKPELIGVVTITDILKDLYAQAGVPSDKIFVWPDAVDVDAFDRQPTKMILRQRLALPPDAFIATYCGHLYQDRGIEDIFKSAWALPSVHFLMIGGWEKDIELRMEEARHLNNIHFRGFIINQQVPEYLRASDVLLMPYNDHESREGLRSPLKMFEYMAAACPIVATDLSALRMHLKHGDNALLVKPGDPKELTEAIKKIMLDKSYADQMAINARRDVSPYTWNNRARAIVERFCTATPQSERSFT